MQPLRTGKPCGTKHDAIFMPFHSRFQDKAHYGTDWRFTTKDARIKLKRLYPSALLE